MPYLNIVIFFGDEYDAIELHNITKCGGQCEFDLDTAKKQVVNFITSETQ